MQHFKTKLFLLLFGFLFTAALCSRVTFTLPNGDVYFGEFEVTD